MWRFVDATVFMEEPPEVDYRDGLFHITVRYGENIIRRCYPPHIFLQAKRIGDAAIAKWQAEQRAECEFVRVFPRDAAAKLYGS